jgi:hypothetical protein
VDTVHSGMLTELTYSIGLKKSSQIQIPERDQKPEWQQQGHADRWLQQHGFVALPLGVFVVTVSGRTHQNIHPLPSNHHRHYVFYKRP